MGTYMTNAFFAAGVSFANASLTADTDAIEVIAGLASQITDTATYQTARGQWVAGYSTASDCKPASAERQWARLWKAAGGTKPQSARAQVLQAKRAADKADKAAPVADKTPDVTSPVNSADRATAVQPKLAPAMLHLVSLVNQCKWAQAHEMLRDMEAKSAPM